MIKDLIGIPFERLGRTRKGADCLGLVMLAHAELGLEAVDLWAHFLAQTKDQNWESVATAWAAGQILVPQGWELVALVAGKWPLPVQALQPGDVIEHDQTARAAHVSIVAEGGWILLTSRRVGCSHLLSYQDFCKRTTGAQRPAAVWRRFTATLTPEVPS